MQLPEVIVMLVSYGAQSVLICIGGLPMLTPNKATLLKKENPLMQDKYDFK